MFKLTFEQLRGIAKERMDKKISYLAVDMIPFVEALDFLSAFKSVGLITDSEYCDYMIRILRLEKQRNR